ncbi:MAG TPA: hypothetical protein VMT19_11340, partial [Thermoanaerobaculaceae bacterium]|nr:hypothetical protein [Thermoanaerobaculaceae bacterium]
MAGASSIEVPLPIGVQPTHLDVELLKAAFSAIVTLRYEASSDWEAALHQLEADGWRVNWGLTWHAEAKKGDDYEQASGRTLDETFAELAQ